MKRIVFLIFALIFQLEALKYDETKSDVLPSSQICGRQQARDDVNINRAAQPDDFPWVVYIPLKPRTHNPDANVRCVGALISKRYVITEKSCLQFYLTKVHLGQYDTSTNLTCASSQCEPVVEIEVEEKVIDESFDVILLRLENEVEFTDHIKPICLPFGQFRRAETGDTVYSSGWGLKNTQETKSLIKKRIMETVSSPDECQKSDDDDNAVDDKLMCVRVDDESDAKPCSGDEGSPVMYNVNGQWVLEGVLNWLFYSSQRPCAVDEPASGTRISEEILEWIVRNVRP